MSQRLNQERQERLEPQRMESCQQELERMGFDVEAVNGNQLIFTYQGAQVIHYPYSGWHTGKTIEDGRGFAHLKNQLLDGGE